MPDPIFLRTPDGNACRFWWGTDKNEFQSSVAGRPVHDKVLMMEIMKPGDRDSKPVFMIERHLTMCPNPKCREAEAGKPLVPPMELGGKPCSRCGESNIMAYEGETKAKNGMLQRGPWREIMHDQIQAFESATTGGAMNGTPLTECAWIDIAQAENFRAVGVHTVEALAMVPDSQLPSLGHNGRALRDRAKLYLEQAKGNEPIAELTAALESSQAELATLKEQMADLLARLPAAEGDPEKRGPGRPRKVA